nr:MAG TPA: hypothetical protein [Caudoviricetes sp.]
MDKSVDRPCPFNLLLFYFDEHMKILVGIESHFMFLPTGVCYWHRDNWRLTIVNQGFDERGLDAVVTKRCCCVSGATKFECYILAAGIFEFLEELDNWTSRNKSYLLTLVNLCIGRCNSLGHNLFYVNHDFTSYGVGDRIIYSSTNDLKYLSNSSFGISGKSLYDLSAPECSTHLLFQHTLPSL